MAAQNITQVDVTPDTFSPPILSQGTGTWDQDAQTITCGTFTTEIGLPQVGTQYFFGFTDSNNQQQQLTATATSSGTTSEFAYEFGPGSKGA